MTDDAVRVVGRDGDASAVLPRELDDAGLAPLAIWERLLLAAVVLMPFQSALTIDVGAPLKFSELLIVASIGAWFFRRRRQDAARAGLVGVFVLVLLVALVLSTLIAALSLDPTRPGNGFTRSPLVDLLFYAAYGAFALLAWSMLRRLGPGPFATAVLLSAWLCFAAVLFQQVMTQVGDTSLLSSLNFRTLGNGLDLGTGDDANGEAVRSGPFVEGQHLGFFSGAAIFVALYRRSWLTLLPLLYCVYFSQSTTAILAAVIAIGVALVLRPGNRAIVTAGSAVVVVLAAVALIPTVRRLVVFQLAKLGLGKVTESASVSLDLRSAKSAIGFRILGESPLWGVGPGRYGVDFYDFSRSFPSVPTYYYKHGFRAIAENSYAQVAAELGMLGLIAFVGVIAVLILKNVRANPFVLMLAVFIAIGVSTQSSWTFLPIWTFIAFVVAASPLVRPRPRDSSDGAEIGDSGRVAERS